MINILHSVFNSLYIGMYALQPLYSIIQVYRLNCDLCVDNAETDAVRLCA